MKNNRMSVKRRPVKKVGLRTLFASIVRKKKRQRASTAEAAGDFESDVPGLGVARALVVMLVIHVIAVAGIFFHSHWLDEEEGVEIAVKEAPNPAAGAEARGGLEANLPKINSGDSLYTVGSGDSYEIIAIRFEIPEADLRVANDNIPIRPGRRLRIPPKMITAVEPAELAMIRGDLEPPLEEVIDGRTEPTVPRAIPVELVETDAARQVDAQATGSSGSETGTTGAAVVSATRHKVKSGETFWGIAKKYGTTSDAVMAANGISNAKHLQIGMNLVIPR